ncbi:retrovirus-related Pol polyprotein from transposon TNT 1-94 isoform X3 [Euphorbia lathyris]|uniref:retrovirus-related Pol polyprotein from transposon TNT 1-94 isoform X3 n=1 Tax=Euphorbia lathyris TaxID=212925 RepID=UPI003313F3C1
MLMELSRLQESIRKTHHLTDDPKTDNEDWMADDACLFLGIKNSIDTSIVGMVRHCEYVQQLMDYLQNLYAGKNNLFRLYDTYKSFCTTDRQSQSAQDYYVHLREIFEQLNELLPLSTDIKVLQAQREQMFVLRYLCGLGSDFEGVTSQILSSATIPNVEEALSRVLRSGLVLSSTPVVPASSALVSHKPSYDRSYKGPTKDGTRDTKSPTKGNKVFKCYYCHEPGHTKRTCPLLKAKAQRNQFAHVGTSDATSSGLTYTLTADEYAKYQESFASQHFASTITTIADSESYDEADYW